MYITSEKLTTAIFVNDLFWLCVELWDYWSFKFLSNFVQASGLTGVRQEVAVWLSAVCPHFEKFEASAPFSPTAAPELCLPLNTKWRLCVTNWFQLAVAMVSALEGVVGTGRGQEEWWVCHMTTEKCLMSCDGFGRVINTHTDLMGVNAELCWLCFLLNISSQQCHLRHMLNPEHAFVFNSSLHGDYRIVQYRVNRLGLC